MDCCVCLEKKDDNFTCKTCKAETCDDCVDMIRKHGHTNNYRYGTYFRCPVCREYSELLKRCFECGKNATCRNCKILKELQIYRC